MAIRVLRVTTRLMSLRSLRRDQDVRRCGDRRGAAGDTAAPAQHPPRLARWRHWLRLSIEQPLARWGVSSGQRHQHSPVWVTRPETTPTSSLRENCLWPQRSAPASLTQVKCLDLDWSLTPGCSTQSCPPPWGGILIRARRCTTCRCFPNSSRTNFLISMVSIPWLRAKGHCNNISIVFLPGRIPSMLMPIWC